MSARSPRKAGTLRSADVAARAEAAAMAEAVSIADDPERTEEAAEAPAAPAPGNAAPGKAGAPVEEAAPVEAAAEEAAVEAEPQEVPRWAAPAVPPPWAGTGQPAPDQAGAGQPGRAKRGKKAATAEPVAAAVAQPRKPFLSQAWINTLAVAGVIAAVVLGGLGLDAALAAPSAGTVSLGDGVKMTAAPGWVKRDSSSDLWVELQKGPVVLYAAAARSNATPLEQLRGEEDSLRSEAHDVAFGPEQSGKIGGRTVEMVVFTAIFDAGTFDGEIICLSVEGRIVLIDVVAAQGYLQDAEDDVATMVKSIEVGK